MGGNGPQHTLLSALRWLSRSELSRNDTPSTLMAAAGAPDGAFSLSALLRRTGSWPDGSLPFGTVAFLLMASRSSSGTAPKCCTLPISSSLQMEQWPWLPGFRIAFARGTLPSATATHAALFWCLRALGFQLRARVTVAVLQPRPVELVSTALQSAGLFTGCSGFSCAHLALA